MHIQSHPLRKTWQPSRQKKLGCSPVSPRHRFHQNVACCLGVLMSSSIVAPVLAEAPHLEEETELAGLDTEHIQPAAVTPISPEQRSSLATASTATPEVIPSAMDVVKPESMVIATIAPVASLPVVHQAIPENQHHPTAPISTPETLHHLAAIPEFEGSLQSKDVDQPPTTDAHKLVEQPSNLQPIDRHEPSPLQLPPTRLFNLETANQLHQGQWQFSVDVRNFSTEQTGLGSGLQTYNASLEFGLNDRLQLGVTLFNFDDVIGRSVRGQSPLVGITNASVNLKYQLLDQAAFRVSVLSSVEYIGLKTSGLLFATSPTGAEANTLTGAVQLPISIILNPDLQLHLTPSVAILPSSLNNAPFYGTSLNLGVGLSWQVADRLQFMADLTQPLSGSNAVRQDGSFFRKPVWSAGLRYLVNPSVGLGLYATNLLGNSPATRSLAFFPDGDQIAIAANLTYTPNTGRYAPDFRGNQRIPLTQQGYQQLLDGITIPTAHTLEPGQFNLRGGLGPSSTVVGGIAYGLTHNVQLEASYGPFAAEANSRYNNLRDTFINSKVQFLDQRQGDPLSLSIRAGITGPGSTGSRGFATAELIAQYHLQPNLTLQFNPKLTSLNNSPIGVGLGFSYQLAHSVQLIGEYTVGLKAIDRDVWSVGLRYMPDPTMGLTVYTTNATGLNPLGGLIGANLSSIGFQVNWLVGG